MSVLIADYPSAAPFCSEAAQDEVAGGGEDFFLYGAIGEQSCDLNGSGHGGEDDEEGALLVGDATAGHKGDHAVLVVDELGEDWAFHLFARASQLGGKRRKRATPTDVLAGLEAQVGFDDGLPSGAGRGLLGGVREPVGDLVKAVVKGCEEQRVFAFEVFVKASMGEAVVVHDGGDGGSG